MGRHTEITKMAEPILDATSYGTKFKSQKVTWTHYWHLYDGDTRINGGLAVSYGDAVRRADVYWHQYASPAFP